MRRIAMPLGRRVSFGVCVGLLAALPASAQEAGGIGSRAAAVDTVIGVQDFFDDAGQSKTQVVFDVSGTVEVRPGVQATLRPKLWRTNRGEWRRLLDQASVRYEFRKGSNWRVEAGRFPSPMGLGLTENRPNLNGGVAWYYRPYYMPLPSLGTGAPRVSLMSTVYPDGAQVATSMAHWDARAAVIDRAPVLFWSPQPDTPRRTNVMGGGGFTPKQGMRIGAAAASGRLPSTLADGADWRYDTINVEGELAFKATKLSGEWVYDEFRSPSAQVHVARGWTLQGRQTLTPRVFAHSRMSTVDSAAAAGRTFVRRTYWSVDSTLGYLVNPEITVRAGHAAMKAFTQATVDHQVGVSLIWARRWW